MKKLSDIYVGGRGEKLHLNTKERAKMMIESLSNEPDLQKEFYSQLRKMKLKKLKKK